MQKSLAAATVGVLAAATLGAAVATASSASASAPCNNSRRPADKDHSAYPASRTAAIIESGSSASCTNLGVLSRGDRADYYCYTVGTGGTWTYLRDARTNYKGWVKDSLLPNDGSFVYCGF